MNYAINIRSLLLLLAMGQAVIVAILLLQRRWRGDIILTGLILALALSLISYTIGFMGVYDYAREHGFDLSFFPFGNFFLYGPLILLYAQALTDRNFRWETRMWWWFLPAIVFYGVHLGVWGATPESEKRDIDEQAFIIYYEWIEGIFFYGLTGVFLYWARQRMKGYAAVIEQEYSNLSALTLRWLQVFVDAFSIYFVIDFCFNVLGQFLDLWYTGFYWLNLVRAILLSYISAAGLAYGRKSIVEYALLTHRAALLEKIENNTLNANKPPLSPQEMETGREALVSLFEHEKPWLDPELTLSQLASRVNLNTTALSYLINTGFSKNFNDFVNDYRVKAVMEKINDASVEHLSLLGIAYECGFNSKATFNRAFKKATGKAPSEFK